MEEKDNKVDVKVEESIEQESEAAECLAESEKEVLLNINDFDPELRNLYVTLEEAQKKRDTVLAEAKEQCTQIVKDAEDQVESIMREAKQKDLYQGAETALAHRDFWEAVYERKPEFRDKRLSINDETGEITESDSAGCDCIVCKLTKGLIGEKSEGDLLDILGGDVQMLGSFGKGDIISEIVGKIIKG